MLNNEPALLRRIAEGDSEAFSQVFHYYSGTVYNTVMTYVKDDIEAQEIVQQVFVKLWEQRANLSEVRNFGDYFFIAVRNCVYNHFNRLSRQALLKKAIQQAQVQEMADDADHRVRQQQYDAIVEEAIVQLPPKQQQVYLLSEWDALNYDEIAVQMQVSRLTVKKHIELARKSVRNHVRLRLKDDLLSVLIPGIIALLILQVS